MALQSLEIAVDFLKTCSYTYINLGGINHGRKPVEKGKSIYGT